MPAADVDRNEQTRHEAHAPSEGVGDIVGAGRVGGVAGERRLAGVVSWNSNTDESPNQNITRYVQRQNGRGSILKGKGIDWGAGMLVHGASQITPPEL